MNALEISKRLAIISIVLIIIAFLLWREFSFVLGGIGVVLLGVSAFYYIKNKIIDRIDSFDETGYLKTFILGNKDDLNSNVMNKYQLNGISHLFSISGMHISLLVEIIMFVLNKISYNNYFKYSVLSMVLIFYLFYLFIFILCMF